MAGESELEGRLSHFSSEPERPEVIISSTTYPALTDGLVVGWEEPEEKDPENPLNWPARTKWANVLMISAITFLVCIASTILAPAIQLVTQDLLHTSSSTSPSSRETENFATFSVSIYVLGFASGPLLLAPLSELYGRMLVYHVTNVLFVAFSILGAAARTEAVFLASRFLSGFVGVATIAVASGTIADVMPREERGRAVAVWSVSTILGPMVGAVLGGYVAEVAGWRWLFWGVGIFAGIATLLAIPILKETNHAVLLSRKAARLRKETGNKGYRSKLASPSPRKYVLMSSIARPIKLLLLYPVVTILCGYVAILYAIIYLLFSTYSFVFSEVYGFSPSAVGLVFVSGAAGTLAGVVYVGYFSDEGVKRGGDTTISITTLGDEEKGGAGGGRIRSSGDSITTTITTITTTTTTTETEKKRKTKTEPESRLPLTITLPGTLLFPAGLFLYGWAVEIRTHWAVPLLGTATTGFASTLVFVAVQAYLIDAFEEFAASAVGANVVLRGIVGAVMPLGGMGLYRELGWGWGNGVLGFVSLGLAPLLVLLGTGVFGGRVGRRVRGFRLGCWEL